MTTDGFRLISGAGRLLQRAKKPVVVASVIVAAVTAGQSRLVTSVAYVDLQRYSGTWHEIARFPNRFQAKCTGDVTATYTLRADGRVDVVNRCRIADGSLTTAQGLARVAAASGNARLEVRFAPAFLSWLPFVWGDYWIIDLGPDYSWAVVGDPSRTYLWILARAPQLPDTEYQRAVDIARAQEFDVARLVRTTSTRSGF